MKTLIKLLIFIALSISFFSQNLFASEKIKIGLVVPLSGENSLIGEKIIKSIRMAINKINDERVVIIPKDTKSNPIDTLKVSKELYKDGVRIIIGPVFNESAKYLDDLKEVTFISFTNKVFIIAVPIFFFSGFGPFFDEFCCISVYIVSWRRAFVFSLPYTTVESNVSKQRFADIYI